MIQIFHNNVQNCICYELCVYCTSTYMYVRICIYVQVHIYVGISICHSVHCLRVQSRREDGIEGLNWSDRIMLRGH